MLENAIELGVNAAQFAAQQQMREEGFDIPPLVFQFGRGLARTFLPDVEDDKLIFRAKVDTFGWLRSQAGISVVGTGIALFLPTVQAAREAARRMQCTNNIKQIVLALHNYHDAVGGLPPLHSVDGNGKPLHSWRVLILPYMEQAALFEAIRHGEPWDSEHNKQFHDLMIPVYCCPTTSPRSGTANCNYSGIAGEVFVPTKKNVNVGMGNTTILPIGHTFAAIIDGTSNTLAVVETKEAFCWMDPTADLTLDELAKGINVPDSRVGSFHVGGMNVGMCDGYVRFISETIDRAMLRALGTKAGGEQVNNFW